MDGCRALPRRSRLHRRPGMLPESRRRPCTHSHTLTHPLSHTLTHAHTPTRSPTRRPAPHSTESEFPLRLDPRDERISRVWWIHRFAVDDIRDGNDVPVQRIRGHAGVDRPDPEFHPGRRVPDSRPGSSGGQRLGKGRVSFGQVHLPLLHRNRRRMSRRASDRDRHCTCRHLQPAQHMYRLSYSTRFAVRARALASGPPRRAAVSQT
mmetsp:Transcript_9382/g.25401  ORF Transcript_9382/g.25401 Transcript_9382/m.25401 type:complete len:207 (-) Transcript_9382:646-1266(-)